MVGVWGLGSCAASGEGRKEQSRFGDFGRGGNGQGPHKKCAWGLHGVGNPVHALVRGVEVAWA